MMSVIGVYLPCLDRGVDCYKEQLLELERIVCESLLLGSVAVLGDFNAQPGGENCLGNQNLEYFCRQCWRDVNLVLSHRVHWLLGLYIPTVVGK